MNPYHAYAKPIECLRSAIFISGSFGFPALYVCHFFVILIDRGVILKRKPLRTKRISQNNYLFSVFKINLIFKTGKLLFVPGLCLMRCFDTDVILDSVVIMH